MMEIGTLCDVLTRALIGIDRNRSGVRADESGKHAFHVVPDVNTRAAVVSVHRFVVGRYVAARFHVDIEIITTRNRHALADLLIDSYDIAMKQLDGAEFIERILSGHADFALVIETAEDEARIERASLRLMEAVEKARRAPA